MMVSLEVPFLVGPVEMQRSRLWGMFLGEATSCEALRIAGLACGALWYEAMAYSEYLSVLRCAARGDVSFMVDWLDGLLTSVLRARRDWLQVAAVLEQSESGLVSLSVDAYMHDARTWAVSLDALSEEVARYVMALCKQYGLVFPGSINEYLEVLFAEGAQK